MRRDGRKMLLQPRDFNVNRSKYLFSREKKFFSERTIGLMFSFFLPFFFHSLSIYIIYKTCFISVNITLIHLLAI